MTDKDERKALVFNIKRSSMEDGPGIRTNIFLKGCPLRCKWCCNPEGQEQHPELHGREDEAGFFERWMTVGEVMEIALKDKVFFQISGGGVTIAGGEPTLQVGFTGEILDRCKALGIHTALDTCGYSVGPAAGLLDRADMLLFDLKIIDEKRHIAATGADNGPILANFNRLGAAKKPMRVRLPLIPGFTDDEENLTAVAKLAAKYPSVERLDIIPFHSYAIRKYEILGKPQILSEIPAITHERAEEVRAFMAGFGIDARLGG
jgi:pyruvate formate lyase activating enzyme